MYFSEMAIPSRIMYLFVFVKSVSLRLKRIFSRDLGMYSVIVVDLRSPSKFIILCPIYETIVGCFSFIYTFHSLEGKYFGLSSVLYSFAANFSPVLVFLINLIV